MTLVENIIMAEVMKLGDSKQVFIGGFSQGCAVAMATWMHFGAELGGVWGSSGAWCSVVDWSKIDVASKKKTPITLYHGAADDLITLEMAQISQAFLKTKGIDHFQDIAEEGLGHSFSGQQVMLLKMFFEKHMK